MHLVRIPPAAVAECWPACVPYLQRAIEYSPTHDAEATKARCVEDKAQLWAVVDTAAEPKRVVSSAVTAIEVGENGSRAVCIELLGGDNMKTWFNLRGELEEWAKREGATQVSIWARKGWQKHLPDYRTTHYVMRKEL